LSAPLGCESKFHPSPLASAYPSHDVGIRRVLGTDLVMMMASSNLTPPGCLTWQQVFVPHIALKGVHDWAGSQF